MGVSVICQGMAAPMSSNDEMFSGTQGYSYSYCLELVNTALVSVWGICDKAGQAKGARCRLACTAVWHTRLPQHHCIPDLTWDQ
jgi:hypothetical protein